MSMFNDFVAKIQTNKDLSDADKTKILQNLNELKG